MRLSQTCRGYGLPAFLVAVAIVGTVAITGFEMLPSAFAPEARMYIDPEAQTAVLGDTVILTVRAESSVPVNVFAGDISFNKNVLQVQSIDYNTSIADLWAVKPWYENGAGTLTFGGGTTKHDGFIGNGPLITITFKTIGAGDGAVHFKNVHILKHDGLGSDASVKNPIDSALTVVPPSLPEQTHAHVAVVRQVPSADINGDGVVNVKDVSIFMLHLLGNDPRFDFNLDGTVDTDDLRILLRKK
jgi:hypothetical protein